MPILTRVDVSQFRSCVVHLYVVGCSLFSASMHEIFLLGKQISLRSWALCASPFLIVSRARTTHHLVINGFHVNGDRPQYGLVGLTDGNSANDHISKIWRREARQILRMIRSVSFAQSYQTTRPMKGIPHSATSIVSKIRTSLLNQVLKIVFFGHGRLAACDNLV